jgi:hypothetical protein
MMFVAHDVLLDVAFGVAQPRLVSLASSRALVDASRAAYEEGLTSLNRAGLGASAPGVRLARVKFLPPVERADTTTVGLRWEASGLSAGLFPVLDADITLAAASEHTTTLTLSGVYRAVSEGAPLLSAPVACPAAAPPLAGPADAPAPAGPADTLPLAGPSDGPGLMAEVTVRALLRFAAAYLTQ